ncbi:MAG: hypothetical protein WAU17_04275 [Nitrospirales bacterium]
MNVKDWGTLLIAVLALFLSSFNTYYQFFYEHHDVKASMFNFGILDFPNAPFVGIRAQADMILLNNGTLYEAISGVRFFYSGCENSPHGIQSPSLIDPIILKPGEKKMISLVDKPNPLKPDVLTSIMPPHAVENYSYKVCSENLKIGKMFVTLEIDLIQENGIPVVVKSKGIPIEKDSNVESLKSIKFSKPDLIFDLIKNQVTTSN